VLNNRYCTVECDLKNRPLNLTEKRKTSTTENAATAMRASGSDKYRLALCLTDRHDLFTLAGG